MLPRSSADRRLPRGAALAAGLVAMVLAGAGPPEVVRLRVPSGRVAVLFPEGTELRGLGRQAFEDLVRRAREGLERRSRRTTPRLVRARHSARWEDGVLVGRSELAVEAPAARSGPLELSPWAPAITPGGSGASQVRSDAEGHTSLWLDAEGPATVTLTWQLRARDGSEGRLFALGLPGLDATSLELDVPAGWVPEISAGTRQGPAPGSGPDRRTWRFDGPGGLIDLRLRAEAAAEAGAARAWVGGETRVEVSGAMADWRLTWEVDPGPSRRLGVELDPGLEPIEVSGPGVVAYQVEPAPEPEAGAGGEPSGTRLTVRLSAEAPAPTPVIIHAVAPVPAEGVWTVPSARPIEATWTGGRTTVVLGPSRVLTDLRERAGQRIGPEPGSLPEAGPGPATLVFEATEPRPVAELVWRRPEPEASAEVRGQVILGAEAPRLEAQVTWTAHRGRLQGLSLLLPSGWAAERILIAGQEDPAAWRTEVGPAGARVHLHPPQPIEPGGSVALRLEATATAAGGSGPLDLPRIRPEAARIADERWSARAEPGWTLRPVEARGLSWIDPLTAEAEPNRTGVAPPPPRPELSWRWTEPNGALRVDRARAPEGPRGTTRVTARLDAARLRVEWLVAIEAHDAGLRTVPVAGIGPVEAAPEWHLADEDQGPPLPSRPLDEARREAAGLPAEVPAWEIELPQARTGTIRLIARLERPWQAEGDLPLVILPPQFEPIGLVRLAVADDLTSEAEAIEAWALDPDLAWDAAPDPDSAAESALEPSHERRAHAFAYHGPAARITVRSEPLQPASAGGVIEEAGLTTRADPGGGPVQQRLNLRVVPAGARVLAVTLPPGATLLRTEVQGRPAVPTLRARAVLIPLPEPDAARPRCLVSLAYREERTGPAGILRPSPPRFSLPCLALAWEVDRPASWKVAGLGPALVAAAPQADRPWPMSVLGARPRIRSGPGGAPPRRAREAMLADFEARVRTTRAEDQMLGEWLTRCDAGRWPLVVDRLALAAQGLSSRTRIFWPRPEDGSPRPAGRVRLARGLVAVPLGGTLLITTPAEAPDRPGGPLTDRGAEEAWIRAMVEAAGSGGDLADRYQSVARWRGEPTPEVPTPAPRTDEPPARLVAMGWPEAGAGLELEHQPARIGRIGATALIVLALGILGRRQKARRRGLALAIILGGGWVAAALATTRPPAAAIGTVVGALAVLGLWVGQALRPREPRDERPRRVGSSLGARSSGSGVAIVPAAVLAVVGLGLGLGAVTAAPDGRILAVFPYDGPPDPDRLGDRVVMRLHDYQELAALAEVGDALPSPSLAASTAEHRVTWRGEAESVVESRYGLQAVGAGDLAWVLPVGAAYDLEAMLDGHAAPIAIRPGGEDAAVVVSGEGPHQLVIRRTLALPREAGRADRIDLPVNPVATARLLVADRPGGGGAFEVPSARGRTGPATGGGIEAALGPAERIVVRTRVEPRAKVAAETGAVDGLILWDALPAGDRVRARLAYTTPGGTSRVRLAVDPGVQIRAATVPGLIEATWAGTAERPEWVARLEPPLPEGTALILDLWRPRTTPGAVAADGLELRRMPRVEPLDVQRVTGTVGFRRPPEWAGDLRPIPGLSLILEEVFRKAWGPLPADRLELAGTLRFFRPPQVEILTGPRPSLRSIRPAVALEVEPGRVTWRAEAEFQQRQGRSDAVEVVLPEALRVVQVEAPGLTDWSRPAPDRLRLRFDGPAPARRTIRLQGWLPIGGDPLATGPISHELPVPWPGWPGVEEEPGTLTITGPAESAPSLATAAGVTRIPPDEAPAAGAIRLSYRVDRPEGLGPLRWSADPARADVTIQGQLTVGRDAAEWVAAVGYHARGGALDALHLRLPTAWAEAVDVVLDAQEAEVSARPGGETTDLTIRPNRPIWGRARVRLRSRRPIVPSEPLAFPDLKPLGRGAVVETRLALADASGRDPKTEGSRGLQPIDASRLRDERLPVLPGLARDAYLVRQEHWSLRTWVEGEALGPGGSTRVGLADLTCVLAADGSCWGLARYEVDPRPGPFLALRPPAGADALAAWVDDRPVRPLRDGNGRWLVPLGEGPTGRVFLAWRTAPAARDPWPRGVPLPGLEAPGVPTLVTVYTPEGVVVSPTELAVEPIPGTVADVERGRWLARRIVAALADVDRGSAAERRGLVDLLVRFELRAREAERSASAALSGRPSAPASVLRAVLGHLAEARGELEEALRMNGLEGWARIARERVGLGPPTDPAAPAEGVEPAAPLRLRRLGRPQAFRGPSPAASAGPVLLWSANSTARARDWADAWAGLPVALAAGLLAAWSGSHRSRPIPTALAGLVLGGIALAMGVPAWAIAAALATVGLGRWAGG